MRHAKLVFILLTLNITALGQGHSNADTSASINNQVILDTLIQRSDTLGIKVATRSPEMKVYLIKEPSSTLKDALAYLFPVFTLLLGIFIEKWLDWYKSGRKAIKNGRRWVAELRAWQEPIKQQIESLDKLVSSDPVDQYIHPELEIVAGTDGDVFKSLDKSDLLHYIERHHKSQDLSKSIKISNQTHGLISIFTNLNQLLQQKFREYMDGTSKQIGIVNENLQKLLASFAKYGLELENQYGDPYQGFEPYRQMSDLFKIHIFSHQHDGAYDLFELPNDFILPLAQILVDQQHDSRADDVTYYTTECNRAIKGLKAEKKYWITNLQTITERYESNLVDIQKITSEIENKSLSE